ncbi:flagellar hook-associated protein 2 [Vogesella sp. LIG4]|nr:flagellar hook-associated protein 2 [Vogesella sp. LIG4]
MAGIDFSTTSPSQIAQQLATSYVQDAQTLLNNQTQDATSTGKALTTLQSALQTFQSALTTLSGKKTVIQQTATFSNTAVANASANGTAQAGNYSFFVSQLASANQVLFQGLPASAAASGKLGISLGDGTSLNVDLSTLGSGGNFAPADLARAINQAAGNSGKVSASIVTVNGQAQLMLGAGNTGANSKITVDASLVGDAALKGALGAAPTQLVPPQDAVAWLGAENIGIKIQQASNTYTGISGVSINFTQAMTSGSAPVSLTVAADNSGTAKNVQSFVDAYNALKTQLDNLTDTGDAANNKSAAAFANDAGVRSLQSRLASLLRQSFNGQTLFQFGISADRNGTLSLNSSKLQTALAANPSGLDQLLGGSSGMLTGYQNYLNSWLGSVNGQIQQRQSSLSALQKVLGRRQDELSASYDSAYNRYLQQFSQLQALQTQMSQTTSSLSMLGN